MCTAEVQSIILKVYKPIKTGGHVESYSHARLFFDRCTVLHCFV